MTENRAVELLEYIRETGNGEASYVGCAQNIAIDMAIKALEEIQLYHELGTTTEIIGQQYELQAIEAIGTIDDFKALKEKAEPKKPLFSTIHGDSAYHCSSCKKFVGFYDTRIYEYCHNCGQKLDWSK